VGSFFRLRLVLSLVCTWVLFAVYCVATWSSGFLNSNNEFALTVVILFSGALLFSLQGYIYERRLRRTYVSACENRIEHAKSTKLLLNMLPAEIIPRLMTDEALISEPFSEASVLFSRIIDFDALAEQLAAQQLIALLNEQFSAFDDLISDYQVYKVETIGRVLRRFSVRAIVCVRFLYGK